MSYDLSDLFSLSCELQRPGWHHAADAALLCRHTISDCIQHNAGRHAGYRGIWQGLYRADPPQAPNVLPTVSAVILADGTKWTFTYDGYGEITRVTLPSGGSI